MFVDLDRRDVDRMLILDRSCGVDCLGSQWALKTRHRLAMTECVRLRDRRSRLRCLSVVRMSRLLAI